MIPHKAVVKVWLATNGANSMETEIEVTVWSNTTKVQAGLLNEFSKTAKVGAIAMTLSMMCATDYHLN